MTENLIDFNFDDEKTTSELLPLAKNQAMQGLENCLSLDNNPFDLMQKLTVLPTDDPFDIVEKEATLKARQICTKSLEVKLGNLLSLSEDSDNAQTSTTLDSKDFYTAEDYQLENESPPITLSTKWSPNSSTASCESSDSNKEQALATKARKTRNQRNRLLKLSISNAVFSTPNSSRVALADEKADLKCDNAEQLIALNVDNKESSIDSESPLKLVDDGLQVANREKNHNYTEKDYEDDLEMLNIPMLNQLPSPEKRLKSEHFQETDDKNAKHAETSEAVKKLPDLTTLREKFRSNRLEHAEQDNLSKLLSDFEAIISKSIAIDAGKKHEVDHLLKSLKSTLAEKQTTPKEETSSPIGSPQPIVRQGTFDIELPQANEEFTTGCPANMDEMPDAMRMSSATYDGETTEDKAHLNLPQIDPPTATPEYEQPLDSNIKGLIEQLQHFLEQQQHLSTDLSDASTGSSGSVVSSAGSNPAFIVVMPTLATNPTAFVSEDTYEECGAAMRRRSQSLSLHDKIQIIQLPIKHLPKIEITENLESPPLNDTLNATAASVDFKTPARFLERRNSFSSATPNRFSKFNHSLIGKEQSSYSATPAQMIQNGLRNDVQRQNIHQRPNLGVKLDPRKKVRTTSSLLKSNAPLKATLPVREVTAAATFRQSAANARSSTSNTSIHLIAKSGHMNHFTSTPMPTQQRPNNIRPLNKSFLNTSSSTSSSGASSAANSTLNLMRHPNVSTTPIGKSLSTPAATSTAHLRRRSISEFKSKSPQKARASFANNYKSNLCRPTTNSTSKNPVRSNSVSSYNQLANKNKENKQPKI